MALGEDMSTADYFRARAELLGPLRTRVLTAAELIDVGRRVYGCPEGFSLYGITAPRMAELGLSFLGRTTIECATDEHSSAVADAVAEIRESLPAVARSVVVDLFCGSGNIAFHLGQRLRQPVFAAELDPAVYRATHRNLAAVGSTVRLLRTDYRALLDRLVPRGPRDIYVVEPPWGAAYTEAGLDLTATAPPVPRILDEIRASRHGLPCLVVIKTNDRIAHDSLAVSFRHACHLRSVTAPRVRPPGTHTDFHIFALPG